MQELYTLIYIHQPLSEYIRTFVRWSTMIHKRPCAQSAESPAWSTGAPWRLPALEWSHPHSWPWWQSVLVLTRGEEISTQMCTTEKRHMVTWCCCFVGYDVQLHLSPFCRKLQHPSGNLSTPWNLAKFDRIQVLKYSRCSTQMTHPRIKLFLVVVQSIIYIYIYVNMSMIVHGSTYSH